MRAQNRNTADKNDKGILSFYVVDSADDPDPDAVYWGDGLWTSGINVG